MSNRDDFTAAFTRAARGRLNRDQLELLTDSLDPTAYLDDTGAIDHGKIENTVAAIATTPTQSTAAPNPLSRQGARDEARRRYGTTRSDQRGVPTDEPTPRPRLRSIDGGNARRVDLGQGRRGPTNTTTSKLDKGRDEARRRYGGGDDAA